MSMYIGKWSLPQRFVEIASTINASSRVTMMRSITNREESDRKAKIAASSLASTRLKESEALRTKSLARFFSPQTFW